ncbi:hypothetical protein C8J57DRAFT_1538629 [Mycena rebaudengoi]|nr:hypothetical protein C8J57DRAFT_1538629 [Mycena rebaudengoi]
MTSAALELRDQNTAWAYSEFLQCLNTPLGAADSQVVGFCLERLSDLGQWKEAVVNQKSSWPVVYLGHAWKSKDKLALSKALLSLGDMFTSIHDDATAHNLFAVALEGITYMDVHCSRAQCMLRLGDLAKKRGEISTAIEFWKSARRLFERSLQVKDMAQINLRLGDAEEAYQDALTMLAALHPPVQLLDQLSISNEVRFDVEEVEEAEEEIGTDVAKAMVPIVV